MFECDHLIVRITQSDDGLFTEKVCELCGAVIETKEWYE